MSKPKTSVGTAILALLLLVGCVSPQKTTSVSNYRSRLDITKRDVSFFNARYIGSQTSVFPPPGNPIPLRLQKDETYEPTQEAKIELFKIYINDRRFTTSQEVKEMAHFIAAKLAIQRSFSKFILISEIESVSSGTYNTARTTGSLTGNTYIGTTKFEQNLVVANGYGIDVILFNDQEPIDQGLFIRYNSGYSKNARLFPFRDLYHGACPTQIEPPPINISGVVIKVPMNAWKTHYEAKQLAEAIKKKLDLSEPGQLSFVDERELNLKIDPNKLDDPLNKLKIEN